MEITDPISSTLPQSPQIPLIPPQNPPQTEHPAAQIDIKLNGTNYAIWSQIWRCISPGEINWGISMGIYPNPHPQTQRSDNEEPKTPLSKVG
jgi:hypothetical protein